MKSLTIGLVCGFALGFYIVSGHFNDRIWRMERQQATAETERRNQLATLSKGYYETYQDAINRPADVVERRVYVKADCVPAGPAPGLGNAANASGRSADTGATGGAGKVALAPDTVDAVMAVADKHQRLYDMCRAKLEYFQNAYK